MANGHGVDRYALERAVHAPIHLCTTFMNRPAGDGISDMQQE
jgi:hypothetical protein